MNYVRSLTATKSGQLRRSDISVEQKLVTHVPDLVVFDEASEKIPHVLNFDGVLLFADVSGFTALTEKYTVSSEKGTDALTVTLNGYIGKIVKFILRAGGDVLKFAGDAILAVWKVKHRADLIHAISQAAKCSLMIQDKCDKQDTDVGVQLRVKIAISSGKIFATIVGDKDSRHFIMAGRPVREVKDAENYCEAGLVVLSPNAMELSDRENIITEPLSNRFALVKYLRREPKKDWRQYIDLPLSASLSETNNKTRMSLNLQPDLHREITIRKYVSPVVQRKVDDDQPLKYLSEMRQCSIAFINLSFDLNEKDRQFHHKQCENMQAAFTIVHTNVQEMQGSLNKIFNFDKGCTFLVIFGLPGDKHEQEPAHALQASWKISQELRKELSSLTLASIGVTTGPVFCGVIGHEERHEYTVIGQKVNMAARLMMHYPNMVACDLDTYHNSKLSKDVFTKLSMKDMKGLGSVSVFKYIESDRKGISASILEEPEFPIIGRDAEIELFMEELKCLKTPQTLPQDRRVIVFEGEAGYGKTRVMKEIEWLAFCEEVHVIAYTLSINDLNTPFYAARALVDLMLKTHNSENKEKVLKEIVDPDHQDFLCLLNDIINVRFPLSTEVLEMSPEKQGKMVHQLLERIVGHFTENEYILLSLDDSQNIDNDSWEYLPTLSKNPKVLLVLAMRPFSPDKPPCESAQQILYHSKTLYVKLSVLMNEDLMPLACQLLRVRRIPRSLQTLLIHRCHGVPLWCEQLLREMQNSGVILIVPVTAVETPGQGKKLVKKTSSESQILATRVSDKNISTFSATSNRVQPTAQGNRKSLDIDSLLWLRDHRETQNQIDRECTLKPNFDLNKFPVPASIRGMALARLDRMKPFEQLLVKTAAVIGSNMSRMMLKAVMPGFSEEKFQRAIYQLMLSHVFECASTKLAMEREDGRKQSFQFSGRSYRIACFCKQHVFPVGFEHQLEDDETIAARCEQFRFHNSLVQETAYRLWLQEQRRSIHEASAHFIESIVNEIFSTGSTDPAILKQFHLSSVPTADVNDEAKQRSDSVQSEKAFLPTRLQKLKMRRFSNLSAPGKIVVDDASSSSLVNTSLSVPKLRLLHNLHEDWIRRLSLISAPGKLKSPPTPYTGRKSICMPLHVKETVPPMVSLLSGALHEESDEIVSKKATQKKNPKNSVEIKVLNKHRDDSIVGKQAMYQTSWSETLGLTPSYEAVMNKTEIHAQSLPTATSQKLLQTSYQIHDNLSLLFEQLVYHWRNAASTEKTIFYLLKLAESKIATMALNTAVGYLQIAKDILDNLDKGLDIVSNLAENAEHATVDIKVLSVNRVTKAKIQKLMGQILFQQGDLEKALAHFTKALKILRCRLPRNLLLVSIKTWFQNYHQKRHIKNPNKYVGSVSCYVARRYIEQVQCLSSIWQVLNRLKEAQHRSKLTQLVSLMQVNLAEAADFDMQELITAYEYMTQWSQMKGDLAKCALYEQKATLKCAELQGNPSTADLYIVGHLHLISCSMRLCCGYLESATSAGYRAYNIADYLGDMDIKITALPLLAQLHLLTGRGRSCVDVLLYHIQLARLNDDAGIISFYVSCFDVILDGGFAVEKTQACVNFMLKVISESIGKTETFCLRTSLSVWFFRNDDHIKGLGWLELAAHEYPIDFDNFFAVRAFTRLVEAKLYEFRHVMKTVGIEDPKTRKVNLFCKDYLKYLQKLCKRFPLFNSRYFHLSAYHYLLIGNTTAASDTLAKAIDYSQSCGNLMDHQWALQSQSIWFTKHLEDSAAHNYWFKNRMAMPDWETAKKLSERTFALKL